MNQHDITYLFSLDHVLKHGRVRQDRTGVGTTSLFGMDLRFKIDETFPLLTTKRVYWKGVVHELLWFLKGDTNIQYLLDNDVHIWDAWATDNGDLGPVYGAQWRSWNAGEEAFDTGIGPFTEPKSVDQIAELIRNLKERPFSRRHVISAWNPAVLPDEKKSPQENAANGLQALPPCHMLFQFYVTELTVTEREAIHKRAGNILLGSKDEAFRHQVLDRLGIPRLGLSCKLTQRSADLFLGVPFNIASYALLTYLVAETVGMAPLEFIWSGGDCHIYSNHLEQVKEQMTRCGQAPASPRVTIKTRRDRLEDYTFDDIELIGYEPLPAIKGAVAV